MRRTIPYIKLSLAVLLLLISLTAALWKYQVDTPADRWSDTVTKLDENGKTVAYQVMVYVDRPIVRSDQECRTYLRIRNVGKDPVELRSTYITNRSYVNGTLYGERIGDEELPDAPTRLRPGETRDILYEHGVSVPPGPMLMTAGTRGFQYNGFGATSNTVTVYVLPSRPFWLALAAIAVLMVWRTRVGLPNYRGRR